VDRPVVDADGDAAGMVSRWMHSAPTNGDALRGRGCPGVPPDVPVFASNQARRLDDRRPVRWYIWANSEIDITAADDQIK
jgi:hypothetical protein